MSAGFSIVVAMDRKRGIGKDGGLPWPKLKGDMKFFRELTTCPDRAAVEKRWGLKAGESGDVQSWDEVNARLKWAHALPSQLVGKQNAVLMGRVTWEGLPEQFRPLPMRLNVVLSKVGYSPENPDVLSRRYISEELIAEISGRAEVDEVFAIGGAGVYAAIMRLDSCRHAYLTEIDAEFECDAYLNLFSGFQSVLFSPWVEEGGIRYRFRRYDRVTA
jgi:dihydrofolate reductase/thymidylate synthase